MTTTSDCLNMESYPTRNEKVRGRLLKTGIVKVICKNQNLQQVVPCLKFLDFSHVSQVKGAVAQGYLVLLITVIETLSLFFWEVLILVL